MKRKRQLKKGQFRIEPKRRTESRLILMRKELKRENPSHYVCWEGTETTVVHEDITQWGNEEGKDIHFLLKGLTLYWEIRHPTSAWGDLLGRSISPISRRQQSKDIWQRMQHEYLNVMIMHVYAWFMFDECWQTNISNTNRSRNQPPGTTSPERKPGSPESIQSAGDQR